MRSKVYKIITACTIMVCMISTSFSLVSAAEPSIKVIKTKGSNTNIKVYLENIENDVSGVQFDLITDKAVGYNIKEWNPQLSNEFTHIVSDGQTKLSFYITGNLPIIEGSLYVGNIVFDNKNVTIGTSGYLKYLNSELTAKEQMNSAIATTTKSSSSDSDDSTNSGSGGSSTDSTDKKQVTNQETKSTNEVNEVPSTVPVEVVDAKLTDIDNHWAEKSIIYVTEKGIMSGVGNDKFEPNGLLTRAMLVKIIFNIEKVKTSDIGVVLDMKYSDVGENEWYTEAINWAAGNKIVTGMGGDIFAPNQTVTREQAAVIIMNYCKYKNIELPKTTNPTMFSDMDIIQSWAKEAVMTASSAEIISGKPNNMFDPKGNATRAEIASIIERFIKASQLDI